MKNFKQDIELIWWFLTRLIFSAACSGIGTFIFMIYNLRVYNVYPGEVQIYALSLIFTIFTAIFFCIGPRLIKAFLFSFVLVVVASIVVMALYHENGLSNVEFIWLAGVWIISSGVMYWLQKDKDRYE